MNVSVNNLRTLLKPAFSMGSNTGTRKGVYSVTTSVFTKSCTEERIRYERQQPKETLKLPLEIIKSGRLHFHFHKFSKKHGNITKFKLLNRNFIVLNSLATVEYILNLENGAEGRLSPFFQQYVFQNKGFSFNNKFTQVCQQQKQTVRSCLNYQIKNNHVLIREELSQTVDHMLCSDGDIDSNVYVKHFLSNLFTKLLIGEALPEDDPDRNALWELIDLLYTLLDPSVDTPLQMFPFLRFLPLKYGRIFKETVKARDRVAKRYFDTQKETYVEGHIRGLVDVCLKIQNEEIKEKGESWLTDDYIKGLMYDTIAAGMTEMMKSIRMLILLMCHYQDTQSRVHAEIDDVIGSGCDVRATDREKMPYTVAVIMEMLRYVSQTPLAIPHKCNNDITLDGYEIKKNSGIFPNLWSIHHDDDVWGDPWCFRPDRFLTAEGTLLPQDHKLRKTLIPFSVGRRRCPGEDFAMSGLFILFTTMLQRVHFLPPEGEELPSADTRLYNNKYPLYQPVFKCRAVSRDGRL